MKIRISDMMDGLDGMAVNLEERTDVNTSNIKQLTMDKVHSARKSGLKLSRLGVIAAVLALCMLCTVTAFACMNWKGFALTGGMSRAEQQALLQDHSGYTVELIDPDGTVHYLDAQGNERFVLSAEEARAYELSLQAAHEEAVQASTALLDVTTTTLIPKSVTEVATDAAGAIPDFMLGNGHLVLLHPENADGYALSQNDQVTIALDANNLCILEFGMVRDGKTLQIETARTQNHVQTFTIPNDGAYCFYIMYYSSDKSAFTNATLTIN